MENYKPLRYIISSIKQTLVTAKRFDLLSVKPFILTLRTIICFRITMIWFFHQVVIEWPLNLTFCGYRKFMKVICVFDELVNFSGNSTLVQTHTVLINSKIFPKYVSWNCLLVYPLSLNVGLRNVEKATWPFSWEWV